ncbi:class I SAM-dependent methyltransferase [Bacteroidota bacterium]
MCAKANIDKWDKVWRRTKPSLTLQVYHKCVADKIVGRVKYYTFERDKPILLDVGCGEGQLDALLAEGTGFQVVALDIVDGPLQECRRLVQEMGLQGKVNLVKASVYRLPFRDNTFDVAVSTGSESAATYPGAPEEVSRAVIGGGHMFFDFTRMPNLYQPLSSIKSYFRYLRARRGWKESREMGNLHYGRLGLKERFVGRLGLKILKMWNMNTSSWPGGKRVRLLFERTLGRVLSMLLARTVLVELRNKDKTPKQEGLA